MSNERHCPDCGSLLPAGWKRAICPACLFGEDGEAVGGTGQMDPLGIAGHTFRREIARGGMGIVYEAVDEASGRAVAIKMVLPQVAHREGMRERFRIETQASASLEHSHILPIYHVGENSDGLPYMTMKLVRGENLARRLADFTNDFPAIAELVAKLAKALDYAHLRGVLHRDIKPGNILFDDEREPYLCDFGLAKMVDVKSDLTLTMQFLGTPHYAAPEVLGENARTVSVSSDVWSLGAVMHELLTGKTPFEKDGLATLLRSIIEDPPVLQIERERTRKIPRDLRVICLTALSKEPASRYASAGAMAADLEAWLEKRPIKARPPGLARRVWYRVRRNPILASLVVGMFILGGLLIGQSLMESREIRESLAQSLLSEAKLERQTGHFDRRERALGLAERAISLGRTPELRDELASILAFPTLDLTTLAQGSIYDFSYSLEGQLLASWTGSGIEITDLQSGEIRGRWDVGKDVYHITGPFSPDDRFLVLRLSNRLEVREVETGKVVLTVPGRRFSLTRDQIGNQTAFAVLNGNITVLRWDRDPVEAVDLGPETLGLIPKAFSPDGRVLVTKREKTPRPALLLVNPETGKIISEVMVPAAGNTQRAVFHQDGRSFFAAFAGGNIHQYPLEGNRSMMTFKGHMDRVTWLGLLNDGQILVSQSEDETTRFWNVMTGETLGILPWSGRYHGCVGTYQNRFFLLKNDEWVEGRFSPSPVCQVVNLPDPDPDEVAPWGRWLTRFDPVTGDLLVSAQQNLHFINPATGGIRKSFSIPAIYDLEYAASANTWLAGRTQSFFRYDHLPDGGVRQQIVKHPHLTARHLAWTGDDAGVAVSWQGRGIQFETGTKKLTPLLPGIEIQDFAVTPDGQTLVALSGKTLTFFARENGFREVAQINPVSARRFLLHDDGRRVLLAGENKFRCLASDGRSLLWEFPHELKSQSYWPMSWSSRTGLIAVADRDERVVLLDDQTGEVCLRLQHPRKHRVWSLALSPDAQYLAMLTSDRLVKIWDLEALEIELRDRSLGFKNSK